MTVLRSLAVLLLLLAATSTLAVDVARGLFDDPTCSAIAAAISSASDVYWPGSIQYAADIYHAAATASEISRCSVEPGSSADVGIILQILGTTHTPFAVKGGGHAYNQHFSSTTGVQIAMSRFAGVSYDARAQRADVGSGAIWDDVYAALAPCNVSVVGGRIPGIGVAGFTLGGGYSWLTNQYGLAVDNVVAIELVVPNGTVVSVTGASEPDLFFALRGGYNNYGIVTKFTLKTFAQGPVWGGSIFTLDILQSPKLTDAVVAFAETNTDPKAGLLFSYVFAAGAMLMNTLLFYDGASPPDGLFDDIVKESLGALSVGTHTYPSLIASFPKVTEVRAYHNTVPVTGYPAAFMKTLLNQTEQWGAEMFLVDPTIQISHCIEPFLPGILAHNSPPSAYPASRAVAFYPTSMDWGYTLPSADAAFEAGIVRATETLRSKALALGMPVPEGDPDVVVYGNYANPQTPVEAVFGASLPRMRTVKAVWDPRDVMGLTGGWKV